MEGEEGIANKANGNVMKAERLKEKKEKERNERGSNKAR